MTQCHLSLKVQYILTSVNCGYGFSLLLGWFVWRVVHWISCTPLCYNWSKSEWSWEHTEQENRGTSSPPSLKAKKCKQSAYLWLAVNSHEFLVK